MMVSRHERCHRGPRFDVRAQYLLETRKRKKPSTLPLPPNSRIHIQAKETTKLTSPVPNFRKHYPFWHQHVACGQRSNNTRSSDQEKLYPEKVCLANEKQKARIQHRIQRLSLLHPPPDKVFIQHRTIVTERDDPQILDCITQPQLYHPYRRNTSHDLNRHASISTPKNQPKSVTQSSSQCEGRGYNLLSELVRKFSNKQGS